MSNTEIERPKKNKLSQSERARPWARRNCSRACSEPQRRRVELRQRARARPEKPCGWIQREVEEEKRKRES